MPALTVSADAKIGGTISIGAASSPPVISAGSGAMSTTNKGVKSIHLRSDDHQLAEILHNGVVRKIGLGDHAIECRIGDLVANGVVTFTTYAPGGIKITGISRRYLVQPASAAGTVVASVTLDGQECLQTSSESEEGLSADTLTNHALTGTAANLRGDQKDKIVITVTSNNADMTGGTDGVYMLFYESN